MDATPKRPAPLPRSTYRFSHAHTTRWADNDAYGHVNNALYYSFFDTTITAYLMGSEIMTRSDDPMFFVVASDCSYLRPIVFPEAIEAGLAVAAIGRTSVTWKIALFGAGEETPRAEGRFVHVCVDRVTQKPRAWPENWLTAFDAIRLTVSPR